MTLRISDYIKYLQEQIEIHGDLEIGRVVDRETCFRLESLPSQVVIREWKTDPVYPNDAFLYETMTGRKSHSPSGDRFIPSKQRSVLRTETIRLFEI